MVLVWWKPCPFFLFYLCVCFQCVIIFHFNTGTEGSLQRGTYKCGCSTVERISRMLTIFRPASFLTDKIETKRTPLWWEKLVKEQCRRNHGSWTAWIIKMSLLVGRTNSFGAGFLFRVLREDVSQSQVSVVFYLQPSWLWLRDTCVLFVVVFFSFFFFYKHSKILIWTQVLN